MHVNFKYLKIITNVLLLVFQVPYADTIEEESSESETDSHEDGPHLDKVHTEINHNAVPDLIASSSSTSQMFFKSNASKGSTSFTLSKEETVSNALKQEKEIGFNRTFLAKSKYVRNAEENETKKTNNGSPAGLNVIKDSSKEKINTISAGKTPLLTDSSTINRENNSTRSPFLTATIKPSFKVSAFLEPDLTKSAASSLSLNSTLNFRSDNRSLFYTGHTVYGGSSARRESTSKRQKLSPVSHRAKTTRTQIRAKPLTSAKRKAVTSETAKRILSTLDRMSSPLKDAKRLPTLKAYKPSLSQQLRKANVTFTKSVSNKPPVQKIEKNESFVLDKTYFKNTARTSSKDHVNMPETVSNVATSNTSSLSFQQTSSKEKTREGADFNSATVGDITKMSMKMKRERNNAHYSQVKEDEIVNTMPEVTKSNVALTMTALPKFNFGQTNSTPLLPAFTPIAKVKNASIQNIDTVKEINKHFSFAKPGIKSGNSLLLTPIARNFSFSSPVQVDSKKSKAPSMAPMVENKCNTVEPPENNNASNKVVDKQKINSFVKQFAKPDNVWECPTYMIDNKNETTKGVACQTTKPGDKQKPVQSPRKVDLFKDDIKSTVVDQENVTLFAKQSPKSERPSKEDVIKDMPTKEVDKEKVCLFVKQFAKSKNDWECPTCLISNNNECVKCVACDEKKPGSETKSPSWLGSTNKGEAVTAVKPKTPLMTFNLPEKEAGSWECPTCMITNNEKDLKCLACTESKPGTESQNNSTQFGINSSDSKVGFSFGLPASKKDSTSAFTFAKPKGDSNNTGFTFGVSKDKSASVEFTFSKGKDNESKNPEISFGKVDATNNAFPFSVSTNSSSTGFSFGIPKGETGNSKDKVENSITTGKEFSFGKSESATLSFSFGKPKNESNNSGFVFGIPKVNSDTTSGFSFGKPKQDIGKNDTSKSGFSLGKSIIDTSNSGFTLGKRKNDSDNACDKPKEIGNTPVNFSFGAKVQENGINSIGATDNQRTSDTHEFSFGKSAESGSGFAFGKSKETNSGFTSNETRSDLTAPIFAQNSSQETLMNDGNKSNAPFKSIADAAKAGFLSVRGMDNTADKNISQSKNDSNIKASAVFNLGPTSSGEFSFTAGQSSTGFPFSSVSKPSENIEGTSTRDSAAKFIFIQNTTEAAKPSFNFGAGVQSSDSKPKFQFNSAGSFNFNASKPAESNESKQSLFGVGTTASFNFGQVSAKPSFMSGSVPSFMSSTKPSFLNETNHANSAPSFNFMPSQNQTNGPSFMNQNIAGTNGPSVISQTTESSNLFTLGKADTNSQLQGRPTRRAHRKLKK